MNESEDKTEYDTNVLIAKQLAVAKNTPVVIASGENYPDALSISSIASWKGWPILLVGKDNLTQGIKDYLANEQPSHVYIVGGPAVVSNEVESQFQSIVPDSLITRLAGYDRFETNALINQTFAQNHKNLYLATGSDFADALAGRVLSSKNGDPIILVDANSPVAASEFQKYWSENMVPVTIFGGKAVVLDSIL